MSLAISGALLGGLAIAGGGIASSMIGTNATQSAASDQEQAALQGQQIQQQEFQQVQQLLAPYVSTGNSAETAQGNLLGLNGNAAQTAAINGIENSGQYQALNQQGQRAILQNAAATGGVRGGNVQASLAQFSPALLQSMIQQQYSNLGGLSTMGENAAAGTGAAGQNMANNVSSLMQQYGSAAAGGVLGSANAAQQGINSITQGLGMFTGLGGMSGVSNALNSISLQNTASNALMDQAASQGFAGVF